MIITTRTNKEVYDEILAWVMDRKAGWLYAFGEMYDTWNIEGTENELAFLLRYGQYRPEE